MFVPTNKTKGIAAAMIAAAALIAGTPAFAEPFVSNGRSVEVRYNDLDLSQAQGKTELQSRLRKAAAKVCASENKYEASACRDKALEHIKQPVSAAIARADTRARYADATPGTAKVIVGN